MAIRIVEKMPDGTLHIHTPAYNDLARTVNYPGLTDADLVQVVIARHQITDYFLIEDSAPTMDAFLRDRDFRDAWEAPTDELAVNMTKARVIHVDRIREVRNAELAKLDIPWMKAVEAGDTSSQATIATEKQTLRDIPATFDITTDVDTPEKLKAKWPTELPARE